VAVFFLRHGEATGIPVHFATPVPQESLPSVPGHEGVREPFGTIADLLESGTKERAAARPALTSPKRPL
jgi:hypothetical protein